MKAPRPPVVACRVGWHPAAACGALGFMQLNSIWPIADPDRAFNNPWRIYKPALSKYPNSKVSFARKWRDGEPSYRHPLPGEPYPGGVVVHRLVVSAKICASRVSVSLSQRPKSEPPGAVAFAGEVNLFPFRLYVRVTNGAVGTLTVQFPKPLTGPNKCLAAHSHPLKPAQIVVIRPHGFRMQARRDPKRPTPCRSRKTPLSWQESIRRDSLYAQCSASGRNDLPLVEKAADTAHAWIFSNANRQAVHADTEENSHS